PLDHPISLLHDLVACWPQPLALDRARHAADVVLDVEHDEELAASVVGLAREGGAGTGGEEQARRLRLAAQGHAIGIAGQERAPQRRFAEMTAIRLVEDPPGERGDLARVVTHQSRADLRRLVRPARVDEDARETRMEGESA